MSSTPGSRTRASIPEVQKKALRVWQRSQKPRPTHAASVAWFEQTYGRRLTQSTISTILSKKYDYLDTTAPSSRLRHRPSQWPILDERLSDWLKDAQIGGAVSGEQILHKADEIFKNIPEYVDFPGPQFSQGWLWKFKQRHQARLIEAQNQGSAPAVPENRRKELHVLRTFCGEFQEDNIYNMDETGLMWRRAPFDASRSPSHELNKDRSRICLMVCTNCTGSDRLPLWVIGHKSNPDALKGVNLKALDCEWRHSPPAWVTPQIMSEWLLNFYQHIGTSRRVLLLLDDFNIHVTAVETTPPPPNVHIQLFPANLPAQPANAPTVRQPLSLGIMQHLKQHYRKRWLNYIVAGFESGQSPICKMSLYHALCWITRNWRHDVANGTIYKAFRKSTLIDPCVNYLSAPKLPEMKDLYEKIASFMVNGEVSQSLEEWLNPVEEEFIERSHEMSWYNQNVDTSFLDDPFIPIPAHEMIPTSMEAISGIQTAIRYMLHQPTTTANDVLYLETLEKVLSRRALNEKIYVQNQSSQRQTLGQAQRQSQYASHEDTSYVHETQSPRDDITLGLVGINRSEPTPTRPAFRVELSKNDSHQFITQDASRLESQAAGETLAQTSSQGRAFVNSKVGNEISSEDMNYAPIEGSDDASFDEDLEI
ncbi:hypothetical protein N7462_000971 [Penicillium macrosclerotiorum]|uniref:uncharacterized protein n=1 Tax=Penicillium macrosclerotiorum TaxID=303699 RepID=UPI00254849F1|nr:uncharacterized protein N7462_000971 [Penicillium macrosclerotiorum]KAJ5698966.1 hypothetical protein N7462_000971 [Penicillium macrosclerotiorum]